jgi:hypothetical protein
MASITFRSQINTTNQQISHSAGSGLGFYGAGYGISVPVGEYQDTTFVTNANGTANDAYALNNTKYIAPSSVQSSILQQTVQNAVLPNYHAPLNIRFTHTEPVRVQNCKLKIFDRVNIDRAASGVTTTVYEVRHPNITTANSGLAFRGEAGHAWKEFGPSEGGNVELTCTASPGVSGTNTSNSETLSSVLGGWISNSGALHQSSQHDWYFALSASPDSIGSKTDYGLYFTCEYL